MLTAASVGGTSATATATPQSGGERRALHPLVAQRAGDDRSSHGAFGADNDADGEGGGNNDNGGGGSDDSTRFDGAASAEWSDTASYTSYNDDDDDDDDPSGGSNSESDDATSRSSKISSSRSRVRSGGATATATARRRPLATLLNSKTGGGGGGGGSGGGDASYDPFAGRPTTADARRRRRRRRRYADAGQGRREAGSDAGYAEDNDSTTSLSDADAGAGAGAAGSGNGGKSNSDDDGGDDGSDDDDDGDADDPLEPIPGEVKLVPSMFPDRPPTVFFEYPKELGMARFNNVYFSEPLGARRLLFKSHWERNSVKNAFFRAGFSRTKSTMSWTASWGKHPSREGFRCGGHSWFTVLCRFSSEPGRLTGRPVGSEIFWAWWCKGVDGRQDEEREGWVVLEAAVCLTCVGVFWW